MYDSGLDYEYDKAVEAMWEEENRDSEESEKLFNAHAFMGYAVDHIRKAYTNLSEAAGEIEGTTSFDKVLSLMNDLEDLEDWAVRIRDNFEKGRSA